MARSQGRANLSPSERVHLLTFLAARSIGGKELKYGAMKAASEAFDCHRNTVRAIWKAHIKLEKVVDEHTEPAARRGRPPKYTSEDVSMRVSAVPARQRTTVRSTAAAVQLPATTIQRYIGKGKALRRVTVHVKPALKPDQKLARLRFALSFVERPLGK